jgi:hypothetical protein
MPLVPYSAYNDPAAVLSTGGTCSPACCSPPPHPTLPNAEGAGATTPSDDDALLLVSLESFELHLQLVGPGEDNRQAAATTVVPLVQTLRVPTLVVVTGRAWKHTATNIFNRLLKDRCAVA